MAEYDENRLTALMEFIGPRLMGEEEYAAAGMNERRRFKQTVLPVALVCFEFSEKQPSEKVLKIKRQIETLLSESMGMIGDLPVEEEELRDAWNAAFPENPLDFERYEDD
jgi:hypothetical protein